MSRNYLDSEFGEAFYQILSDLHSLKEQAFVVANQNSQQTEKDCESFGEAIIGVIVEMDKVKHTYLKIE